MKEENQAIIKALNMYGRVPEQWELLNEIERLNNIIKEVREYILYNCIRSDEWTELDFCEFIPTGNISYKQLSSKKVKEVLQILDKGE